MPYLGQTYKVPQVSGWNANPNYDYVPNEAMLDPKNINHHRGGREPRGGSVPVFANAITSTPQIMGGFQYTLENGDTYMVVACSNGTIYVSDKNDFTVCDTQIKSGLGSSKYSHFETFYNKLYICNGNDIPQIWDGTSIVSFLTAAQCAAPTVTIAGAMGNVNLGSHYYKITHVISGTEYNGTAQSLSISSAILSTAQRAAPTVAMAGVAGNVDNGAHYYKITFIINGAEYNGTAETVSISVADKSTDGQVSLTGVPVGPAGTTARNIYRTEADGVTLKYLAQIADNTTTTYTDNIADSSLTDTILDENMDTVTGQISLSGIAVGPTGTTARKIYRTDANGSALKLLATIADNTTTTYTDNIADSSLGAAIPSENIGLSPSDWTGTSQPKAMISHGIRAQKRLWAYVGNYLYASRSGTADFSDTEVTTIKILCKEITGLIEFGGRLLAFSKDKTFIVDDTSIDISEWGYQAAIWEGGAAHQRLIIKTPTDVMVMSETAEMFSITASQNYGDYQTASLTRPSYLHKWVETALDLTKIEQFHGIYDQELRCIKIFVTGIGNSYPDIAMVYFVDLGAQAGWTKHEFMTYMRSSWVTRVSVSDWKIYTGGSVGKVYSLESTTLEDDGSVYRVEWSTPPMIFDNPRSKKRYDRMWLVMKPVALETISVDILIDDKNLSGNYLIADEYGNIVGDELLNSLTSESINPWEITMTGFSNILQNYADDIGYVGTRIQAVVYNTLGENFFISSLMFDLLELGSFN